LCYYTSNTRSPSVTVVDEIGLNTVVVVHYVSRSRPGYKINFLELALFTCHMAKAIRHWSGGRCWFWTWTQSERTILCRSLTPVPAQNFDAVTMSMTATAYKLYRCYVTLVTRHLLLSAARATAISQVNLFPWPQSLQIIAPSVGLCQYRFRSHFLIVKNRWWRLPEGKADVCVSSRMCYGHFLLLWEVVGPFLCSVTARRGGTARHHAKSVVPLRR